MEAEAMMVTMKKSAPRAIRYEYCCSHCRIKYQAIGAAIKKAIPTSNVNSPDMITTIDCTDAPSTLRIPISFRRCTAIKETSPYRPRQEIKIAIAENIL